MLMTALLLPGVSPAQAAPSPPATTAPPKASASAEPSAPVTLGGVALFSVPKIHSLSAEKRAALIGERLVKIADDPSVSTDSITSVDVDIATDIGAGDRVIMALLDADARAAGVTRQELAKEYTAKIRAAIERYRRERLPQNIMKGVVVSVVATLLLVGALLLLRPLYRRLLAKVELRGGYPISFQKFELLHSEQVRALLNSALRGARLATLLLLFYLYLHVTLSAFPWTRPFVGQLLNYMLVPLGTMEGGLIRYIPNLIFLVILAVLTHYLLKFMHLFAQEVEKGNITLPGFYPEWAKPTFKIARLVVLALVAVVAFPYLPGSESPAFKGISIFLGVLISLGSSSTVSNVIAGLDLTYRRAFLKGDYVKIGEFTGQVTRMRLLVTHLRTFKNEEVVLPNAVILGSHVMNFSSTAREGSLILHTTVTIGYNTPWRQVHAFLLTAAERTQGVLRDPPPFVLQTALDDFYVRYELNVYTDSPQEMLNIYSNLYRNIQDAFNEYEVQIMSPHYMLDPSSPAVVPKSRWYEPPARPPEEPGPQG